MRRASEARSNDRCYSTPALLLEDNYVAQNAYFKLGFGIELGAEQPSGKVRPDGPPVSEQLMSRDLY